jgi:hypothetical protein
MQEKSRAYKLAYALEVAETLKKKAEVESIGPTDALRLALEVHPLQWWIWELRRLPLFSECTERKACQILDRLVSGHPDKPYGVEDLNAGLIATILDCWVDEVNNEEYQYDGEVAFVGRSEDDNDFIVYTYDPHPADSLDSVIRTIATL